MLNTRQRHFVYHYLATGNATEAAKRAGYSAKRAAVTGHDLVRNRNVADEISRLQRQVVAKLQRDSQVSYETLLAALAVSAYGNIADFYEVLKANDPLEALRAMGPRARAVASITVTPGENGSPKITLRLRDGDAAAVHLINELRKGPPPPRPEPLPDLDLSDLEPHERREIRQICAALKRRREEKRERLEREAGLEKARAQRFLPAPGSRRRSR
jgi:phage terminase small subunit